MTDSRIENQRALLLFHVFVAKDRKLSKGDANKKLTSAQRRDLNLSVGAANQLRAELAHAGYLQLSKERRKEVLQLTEKGLAHLTGLRHIETVKFTMTGKALNALLDACSRLRDEWEESVPPAPAPAPTTLESAIVSEFQELLRERFGHTGLVPIHEVRRSIAAKLGAHAARHESFDPAVQRLRQEKKLELVPISDLREASAEQLNESIPGVNETLFYLEPAREQAIIS